MADAAILLEIELAAGTFLGEHRRGRHRRLLAALEVVRIIRLWGRLTEAYSAAGRSVSIAVTPR